MQEIRQRVEDNPFDAVFGRSVMRLYGDQRLADWAKTLFDSWSVGATDEYKGKRGTGAEGPRSTEEQQAEPRQPRPPQENKDRKNDEAKYSSEEFEFDPITMRRVPKKTRVSESVTGDSKPTILEPKESQSTSKTPSPARDKSKDGDWEDIPVKKFSGYQRDSVIYVPETKTEGISGASTKDQTSQKDVESFKKVPKKGRKSEELDSSWENIQAGMIERKVQYEQMSSRIGKESQVTQDAEKSAWLDREGFASASTPVRQQTPEASAQTSNKSYYRPRPRHQLLSEDEPAAIRSKEYRPSTGELKGRVLETAAERLHRRTDMKSDFKSHEKARASIRDPAEAIRHREILETLVEHRRRGTETMIEHAQRFIANLRQEMAEKTPEIDEQEFNVKSATAPIEGEGDLCKHVHIYAERSPLFNRSPSTFQERAETEKRAWAKHDQKVKDQALVREIRSIYEDGYGPISTKHRQVGTPNRQLDVEEPASVQESRTVPDLELAKPVESAPKLQESSTSPDTDLEKSVEATPKDLDVSATSNALPEQITYRILAFDPQSQEITSATSTSSSQSQLDASAAERIISVPEALLSLNSPARFLPYFAEIQAEGYELIRGSGDVVVFKQVREASTTPAPKVDKVAPPAYSYRDTNPIDGTTTGNYASPTGFVNHDAIVAPTREDEVSDGPKAASGAAKVTRQEPVFSGGQRWQEANASQTKRPGRARRVVRRVFWGAVWVGACSYAVGVVVEFFTTGGSDGLGAVGF